MSIAAAAKAALVEITKHMATDLGPFGIRVNCVSPNYVLTDAMKDYINSEAGGAAARPVLDRTPLGHFCEVKHVVDTILFLLSDKSAMTTGSNLWLDGGYMSF